MDIKIRTDFQSIKEEVFRLNEYGKIFHSIGNNYTNFKNQEDFFQIYSLDEIVKNIFDKLYNSGADCSFAIYHILENINYFDFYPTLTDLVNELEEKISCISKLEIILSESEEAHNKLDTPLYSIQEMNRLHEKQIDYLSKIEDVILKIRKSHLYKEENNLLQWYQKISLPSFIVRIINLDKDINHEFDYLKLKSDLIEIALVETKNRNAIFKESEDETNDRFRNAIHYKNYNITDQSRGGESSSGINAGERDLVIRNERGVDESVIEAFILKSLDSTVINKHYEKLVKRYDTSGNRVNFVLVYSKTKNFDELWEKYIEFDGFNNFVDTQDEYSQKDNVRVGVSEYKKMKVYHLFINFYSYDNLTTTN